MAKDEKNKKAKKSNSNFWKESKSELKRVNWPTGKQLTNDTMTVIGLVLLVAIIVFVLDFAFLTINEKFLIEAEKSVKGTTSVVQEDNTTDETNSEGQNSDGESTTVENETVEGITDTELSENSEE